MPYCTSCGYAVSTGAQFCRRCGKVNAGEPAAPPGRPAPAAFPSWVLVVLLALFASRPETITDGVRGLVGSADTIAETLGRAATSVFNLQLLGDAYSAFAWVLDRLSELM